MFGFFSLCVIMNDAAVVSKGHLHKKHDFKGHLHKKERADYFLAFKIKA